jgi:hypothetical protein
VVRRKLPAKSEWQFLRVAEESHHGGAAFVAGLVLLKPLAIVVSLERFEKLQCFLGKSAKRCSHV